MLFKNWFLSKSVLMIYISLIPLVYLFYLETKMVVYVDLNSILLIPFNLTFMIDQLSMTFLTTVSLVSSIVIIYSFLYLDPSETEISMKKFLMVLILFISSMLILSLSANIFWLMVGWDGLGISSFCLIIFYQNWKSFSSGMVTFMSNRLGDVMIIFCIVWTCTNLISDSWVMNSMLIFPFSMLISIGAYSKSAQLPYLFWLPQAMAAPTPVSALVHSSTLVTAGIFTMCRFGPFNDKSLLTFLFIISSVTVMIAGTSSLMENDLKKVIALSTLCHISLMMMFSVIGDVKDSSIHMMMHAFFKSLLFMVAGYLIHTNLNFQDIRWIKMSKLDLKVSHAFFISILSMMGLPFMSGFYSKEMLLSSSSYFMPNISIMIMFIINSFFSCAYSCRLAMYVYFSSPMIRITNFSKDMFSNIFIISSILSSFSAGMIMFILWEQESIQSNFVKTNLLIFSMAGMLTGMMCKYLANSDIKTILQMFTGMWKSNNLYKIMQKSFFSLSKTIMWNLDEKGFVKNSILMLIKSSMEMSMCISEMTIKQPFTFMKMTHVMILSMIVMTT